MFMSIYRPSSQNKQYFLNKLSEIIDHYSRIYDNYIILGNFNMKPSDALKMHLCNLKTCLIQPNQAHLSKGVVLHRSDSYKPKVLF